MCASCLAHLPSEWQNPSFFFFFTPAPLFFLNKPQIPLYRSCYKAKILGLLGNTHFPKPTMKTRHLSKNIATPGWQCSQSAQLLVVVVGNFPIANPLLFHFYKASQTFQQPLILQMCINTYRGLLWTPGPYFFIWQLITWMKYLHISFIVKKKNSCQSQFMSLTVTQSFFFRSIHMQMISCCRSNVWIKYVLWCCCNLGT